MTANEINKMINYPGWWDGPDSYSNINRNIIAKIQRDLNYRWVMSLFPGGNGLEIGASGFKDKGCMGVSPIASNMADILDDGRYLKTIASTSIDYILSSHVFEHLNQEPIETLKRWFEVLKPNGVILIIMPDKNKFIHDSRVKDDYDAAVNEMAPCDMAKCLEKLSNYLKECNAGYYFEKILFNEHNNNFDFEVVIKKIQLHG